MDRESIILSMSSTSPPSSAQVSSGGASATPSPNADLKSRPEYRLVAQYLTAVLDTLRRHYGVEVKTGALYRKGGGEDPKVDMAILFGGANERGRLLLSFGASQGVMDSLLARGPESSHTPSRTFVDLVEKSLTTRVGPAKEFRRLLPTVVRGASFSHAFLTTGSTAIVPLSTPLGSLSLQISRESASPFQSG